MPLNVPGIFAPFQLLFRPHLVIPSLVIKDLRCLDFRTLHKAGYQGAVFDKDNCLTSPYEDTLVPDLKEAWEECKSVFGAENILVVSNSAGTRLDPAGIEAESVSYHLGVHVLRHDTMKPGYACIRAIRAYFAALPSPVPDNALFIVGDRIFTDVVLANRMGSYRQQYNRRNLDATEKVSTSSMPTLHGPLSVFVERIWKRDSIVMRYFEEKLVDLVRRWNDIEDDDARRLFVRK